MKQINIDILVFKAINESFETKAIFWATFILYPIIKEENNRIVMWSNWINYCFYIWIKIKQKIEILIEYFVYLHKIYILKPIAALWIKIESKFEKNWNFSN